MSVNLPAPTVRRVAFGLKLAPAAAQYLRHVAASTGMTPSALGALILENFVAARTLNAESPAPARHGGRHRRRDMRADA